MAWQCNTEILVWMSQVIFLPRCLGFYRNRSSLAWQHPEILVFSTTHFGCCCSHFSYKPASKTDRACTNKFAIQLQTKVRQRVIPERCWWRNSCATCTAPWRWQKRYNSDSAKTYDSISCYFEEGGVTALNFGSVYESINNSFPSCFKSCTDHKEFLSIKKKEKSFRQRRVCCKYLK